MTSKMQLTKEKIDKLYFIKIKSFVPQKIVLGEQKDNPQAWEDILAKHIWQRTCTQTIIKNSQNQIVRGRKGKQ